MTIRLPPACAELLHFQSGVIARWQAAAGDLNPSLIDALLRRDRWRALYSGVYSSFTGEPTGDGTLWAAVLRCGPDAILSHFTAASLDGLAERRAGAIHVTVGQQQRIRFSPQEFRGGMPRIIVHRSVRITDIRHPARTPPRTRITDTVLDLTDVTRNLDDVFSWLSTACSRRLVTPGQLREAAGRRSRLRWRAEIMLALGDVTRGVLSVLERRYYRGVERAHGLPQAARQVKLRRGSRTAYLDNFYAEFGLVVELDGLTTHPAESRWRDIHRDNYSASTGLVTLRYNLADVTIRQCEVASQVAQVLRLRGWTGTLRRCGPSCQAALS